MNAKRKERISKKNPVTDETLAKRLEWLTSMMQQFNELFDRLQAYRNRLREEHGAVMQRILDPIILASQRSADRQREIAVARTLRRDEKIARKR